MATSWSGSDRIGLGSRLQPATAAAATNQNAVEAFKCNEHEANSLPLSSPSSATSSPSNFISVGKSGQLSDECFVRLSLRLHKKKIKILQKQKHGKVGPSGYFLE